MKNNTYYVPKFLSLLLCAISLNSCLSGDKSNTDTIENIHNSKTIEASGCGGLHFGRFMLTEAHYDTLHWVVMEFKNDLALIDKGFFSIDLAEKPTEFSKNVEVMLVDFQPCLKSMRETEANINSVYCTYSHCSDIKFGGIDAPYYYKPVSGKIQVEAQGEGEGKYGKVQNYLINLQDCIFKHDSTKSAFYIPALRIKAKVSLNTPG